MMEGLSQRTQTAKTVMTFRHPNDMIAIVYISSGTLSHLMVCIFDVVARRPSSASASVNSEISKTV